MSDELLGTLLPKLAGLRTFLLANAEITDASMKLICDKLKHLTHLDISECREVTDEGQKTQHLNFLAWTSLFSSHRPFSFT